MGTSDTWQPDEQAAPQRDLDSALRRPAPLAFLAVVAGLAFALVCLLLEAKFAIAILVGLALVAGGLFSPGVVFPIWLFLIPLIPRYAPMMGVMLPDTVSPVAFALFAAALIRRTIAILMGRNTLRLSLLDVLVILFSAAVFFSVRIEIGYWRKEFLPEILAYGAIRLWGPSREEGQRLIKAFVAGATICAAIMLIEASLRRSFLYGIVSIEWRSATHYQPGGGFSSPIVAGYYLATAFPFALYLTRVGRRKWLAYLASFLIVLAVLATQERGPWLSVAVIVLFLFFFKPYRGLCGFLLVGLIFFAVVYLILGTGSYAQRLRDVSGLRAREARRQAAWVMTSWPQWDPLRGLGYGRYDSSLRLALRQVGWPYSQVDVGYSYAHNDWLSILVESGMLALVLFAVFWLALAGTMIKALIRNPSPLSAAAAVMFLRMHIWHMVSCALYAGSAIFPFWMFTALAADGQFSTPDPATDQQAVPAGSETPGSLLKVRGR